MKTALSLYLSVAFLLINGFIYGVLADDNALRKGIPISFKSDGEGYVTLVIEDESGSRIKNLVFDYPVNSGDNVVYWDGSTLTGVAAPGNYKVRGFFHKGISPRLEYSIYSPGTPPWPTADGTGGWLADHTAPASVLFVPGGSPWPVKDKRPVMMLGSDSGEAGHALVWTDLDGKKLGGTKIRGWNGGIAMARDIGSKNNPDHVAYTVFVKNPSRDFGIQDPGALDIYVITNTGVEMLSRLVGGIQMHDAFRQLVGMAAMDGLLLLSNPAANEIAAYNVRKSDSSEKTEREPFARIKIDNVGGITFEPDGKLLVVTNGEVKRFSVKNDWKSLSLDNGKTVVKKSGLQAPKQIITHDGKIYITDWGKSHQVKVFDSRSGNLLFVTGKPGGPQIGAYDELRMAHPLGMSVDSNGILWVAETDYLPKRISRWDSKTGNFINAWYGPTQYGGGGFVDPKDKSRAYYPSIGNPGSMGLLEFKVDLNTGKSKMTAVRYRDADPVDNKISYGGYRYKHLFFPNDAIPLGSHGGTTPAQTFYCDGKQYFTNSYNTYWYNQGGTATLWIMKDEVCRPVASAGWVQDSVHRWIRLNEPDIKDRIPTTDGRVFFIWSDVNNDHAAQADEIKFICPPYQSSGGVIFQPDLSIISGGPFMIPVNNTDKSGTPHYDPDALKVLSHERADGEMAMSPDGWLVAGFQGFQNGQKRWELKVSKSETPPSGMGDIKDPKRMLGYPVKSAKGEAGYLLARYSYMGEIYIYSVDGIMLTTLGGDTRTAPFWPYPEEIKNMEIKGLSFEAEHFWPFMFGLDDGNVYLSVGKWHNSLVRLDGLENVRRINAADIKLTSLMILETFSVREQKTVADALRDEVPVRSVKAVIDGYLKEWPDRTWADINPETQFQLGINGDKLVAAYRSDQDNLLLNSADEYPFAFTQGGGLDIMLRTSGTADTRGAIPGDIRLFVTKKEGKTLAVLYRQRTPEAGNRQVFASPVGQVVFDDVKDVSAFVEVASNGGNYELSVPLSILGLENPSGKKFRGDVGIVVSDGTRARARMYWHNKEDSMCSDIPSEARFNPREWGMFGF